MNFKEVEYDLKLIKYCLFLFIITIALIWSYKDLKAKYTKNKLEDVKIGMSINELISLVGEPSSKNNEKFTYRTNFNPIYPIRTVVRINNGFIDTIYVLED